MYLPIHNDRDDHLTIQTAIKIKVMKSKFFNVVYILHLIVKTSIQPPYFNHCNYIVEIIDQCYQLFKYIQI